MNYQNVTDLPNNNTVFLVWVFKKNITKKLLNSTFEKVCGLVGNLNNSVADRFPEGRASVTIGISHSAWLTLGLPEPLPKELKDFQPIKGSKHTAVSTEGDLHFHIRAHNQSLAYDMAAAISEVMQPIANCIVNVQGFRYWDGRAIIGFVDGTENPRGAEREQFAVVGDEDPDYQGGSYLFVQKYVHDMNAWRALPVSEQEKVIGRSKEMDIEMDDDTKPSNSHSALANVGDDLKVVRDNMPFHDPISHQMGTYFICYANTFSTVEKMLTNMFIGNPAGNYDRLLDFSTAETGTLFFVPSLDMLDEFAG
ncbi:peroxidase [Capnocytophaga sputigena]|uniref:Peroxidase n=1 Tax=Capnocytophaga sputigena TaxID=1019 RepID=A0A250F8K2_CAPSP|nr:Dyp-type peroxidase [Capnocytophaga sputigena]ATA80316.1 peroxidase [Capnocytophaga sputigena]